MDSTTTEIVTGIQSSSTLTGKVITNNSKGRIEFYTRENVLYMMIGDCGNDQNGNPLYGIAEINESGIIVAFSGFQVNGF